MRDIFAIEQNKEYWEALTGNIKSVVPFIGAGFSAGFCPDWKEFLTDYYQQLKDRDELLPEELKAFEDLRVSSRPDRLEAMADFLVEKSKGLGFKEEMNRRMSAVVPPEKSRKFHLLHQVFPYLKITTNYDTLIETTVPHGVYVKTVNGSQTLELERLFTLRQEQNSLLKIHGGIDDMKSIVLSSQKYRELYGDPERYDINAALPAFLKRVFTNASVLFIGCSLDHDRTALLLEDLKYNMPRHFCLVKLSKDKTDTLEKKRRLKDLGIYPIWLEDYWRIEDILARLAGEEPGINVSLPRWGLFVGREKELDTIARNLDQGGVQTITGRLYSIDGAGGVGKTALALQAARLFKDKFNDGVLPLFRVDEHTPVSFAVKLAEHLGMKIQEPPDNDAALREVTRLLHHRHCLLILDNVEKWEDIRYMIPLQSSAAILVTTRNRDFHAKIRNHFPALKVTEIPLEKFTEKEALALFERMLASEYREADREIYLEIAASLGYLPIAMRQAVSLMAYSPHYRPRELRDTLRSESKLDVLRQGCAEAESDSRVIEAVFDLSAPVLTEELKETLALLAVCAPGPVPYDFLQRLEKHKRLRENLERLYTYSWCEHRENREREGERFYELHQLVRELVRVRAQGNPRFLQYRQAFINLVHDLFTDESVHFSIKDKYYFQLEEAFAAMVENKDPRLKDWLYDLAVFCINRGYGHFYVRLSETVERLFPEDKWTMRVVYAHRAVILKAWGKLEEAMALLKKQEALCEELGDRDGLSACYGNQANIHYLKGEFKEAMALHKKVEEIFVELGDRAGLSTCYGNQALILSDWGKLEEAMALHKKEEALCEELGDRAGLAICYDNMAVILRKLERLNEAMELHIKAEKIFEELGMMVNLSECYGNQAIIHREKSNLQEALRLHKKEEIICEEKGDRAGLARTWWNQGFIYGKQGDPHTQARLWQKSIETNKSMGIPTEEDEKALKELLEEKGEIG